MGSIPQGGTPLRRGFRGEKGISFLTAKTNESAAVFKKEAETFKKEFPAIEVKIYPNLHELHDRYILTQNAVLIVGHGIKDLGAKESFVLLLKEDIAADMRKTLMEKFNDRWNRSVPLWFTALLLHFFVSP